MLACSGYYSAHFLLPPKLKDRENQKGKVSFLHEGLQVTFFVPQCSGFSGCYTLTLKDWLMAY
jgi:hypothetical protein